MTAKGYGVSFWGHENILRSDVVRAAQLHEHPKNHGLVLTKWAECVVCELQRNKVVKRGNGNLVGKGKLCVAASPTGGTEA